MPAGWVRWVVTAVWIAVPLVRLAIFAPLLAAAGVVGAPLPVFEKHIAGALVNSYVLLIALVGLRPVSDRIAQVAALGNEQTARVARFNGSVLGPGLFFLVLAVASEASVMTEYGVQAIGRAPLAFGVELVMAVLIRFPQAVALWTGVVALATVAELGRHPVPGTFPEDRSLGLRKVGTLFTTILLLYVVVLVPAFIFGTSRLVDFLTAVGITVIALASMVVAVWQIHRRMVAERAREVEVATTRYAAAYRRAAADSGPDAGAALQTSQTMLDGAKSIHEWPFDDRTERLAGLLLTSVLAGVIVRLVLIGLGF
jgi:hypothetical protein